MQRKRHAKETGRVLRFARPGSAPGAPYPLRRGSPPPSASPVDGIEKYEGSGHETDDYRHRQMTNVAAFVVCALLVVVGIWIAHKIADLRRDQDCVLAGRRNCAQISIIGNSPQ